MKIEPRPAHTMRPEPEAKPAASAAIVVARPNPVASSLKFLIILAVATLLYFAHEAFVPVALALLLALVLSGPVECLHSWRVPRILGAALIMAAILGALIALGDFISEPAQQWFASAPHTIKVIEKKIRPFEQLMARIDSLKNSAGNIGSAPILEARITPRPLKLPALRRRAHPSCCSTPRVA